MFVMRIVFQGMVMKEGRFKPSQWELQLEE